MLWTLVVILLVFWALGLAFKVASGLIHILLVIALVVIVFRLISGRRWSDRLRNDPEPGAIQGHVDTGVPVGAEPRLTNTSYGRRAPRTARRGRASRVIAAGCTCSSAGEERDVGDVGPRSVGCANLQRAETVDEVDHLEMMTGLVRIGHDDEALAPTGC